MVLHRKSISAGFYGKTKLPAFQTGISVQSWPDLFFLSANGIKVKNTGQNTIRNMILRSVVMVSKDRIS